MLCSICIYTATNSTFHFKVFVCFHGLAEFQSGSQPLFTTSVWMTFKCGTSFHASPVNSNLYSLRPVTIQTHPDSVAFSADRQAGRNSQANHCGEAEALNFKITNVHITNVHRWFQKHFWILMHACRIISVLGCCYFLLFTERLLTSLMQTVLAIKYVGQGKL